MTTISNIIETSWPLVITQFLNHKNWYSHDLIAWENAGRLRVVPFSYGLYDPKTFAIRIPITWSKADELNNYKANHKIDLVKNLLTNAIKSHDDILMQQLVEYPKPVTFHVDQAFHYVLSPVIQLPDINCSLMMLRTIVTAGITSVGVSHAA